MKFKDLIKTTEGIVVISSLILTIFYGKVFAILGGIIYLLINIEGWGAFVLGVLKKAGNHILSGLKLIWKYISGKKMIK